jgi:hypothetical protein
LAAVVASDAKQRNVLVAVNAGIPLIDTVDGLPLLAVAIPLANFTDALVDVPAQAPAKNPQSTEVAPETVIEAFGKVAVTGADAVPVN